MKTQQGKGNSGPSTALADIQSPESYVETRTHVFPSVESWRWWFRKHRQKLFQRGAVLEIAGRVQVVAPKCDAAVLELGTEPRKTQGARKGPLTPLRPEPAVYAVPSIELVQDDRAEVSDILRSPDHEQAYIDVVSEERAKLQSVLGHDIGEQPGIRVRPTTPEKREQKKRLSDQLSNLRDAIRQTSAQLPFDASTDLPLLLRSAQSVNPALTDAAMGVLSCYRDLDDWTQADVDWIAHSSVSQVGSPTEWLDAIIRGLETYKPTFRAVPSNAIPVSMIRQIAKICAEAGVSVTRNDWLKETHGSGSVTPFERLVEIARLWSGHPENDRGDVSGWLRHVATKEFCDGWNAYGEKVRTARDRAV